MSNHISIPAAARTKKGRQIEKALTAKGYTVYHVGYSRRSGWLAEFVPGVQEGWSRMVGRNHQRAMLYIAHLNDLTQKGRTAQ